MACARDIRRNPRTWRDPRRTRLATRPENTGIVFCGDRCLVRVGWARRWQPDQLRPRHRRAAMDHGDRVSTDRGRILVESGVRGSDQRRPGRVSESRRQAGLVLPAARAYGRTSARRWTVPARRAPRQHSTDFRSLERRLAPVNRTRPSSDFGPTVRGNDDDRAAGDGRVRAGGTRRQADCEHRPTVRGVLASGAAVAHHSPWHPAR